MNIEETKEAIKVMQAFMDGKEVEFKILVPECFTITEWRTIAQPAWDFNCYTYRIKPTTTLRPWTPDEVPLGCQLRSKSYHPDHRSLITTSGNTILREGWLNQYEHSTDKGVTWLPCGVMEEAKC